MNKEQAKTSTLSNAVPTCIRPSVHLPSDSGAAADSELGPAQPGSCLKLAGRRAIRQPLR